jgi:hypothetical protein
VTQSASSGAGGAYRSPIDNATGDTEMSNTKKITATQEAFLAQLKSAGGSLTFTPCSLVKTARALEAKGFIVLTSKTTHFTEYTATVVASKAGAL